ncbi:MAG: PhoU domain-containing protein [Desulfovibrionales bacterium]
MITFEGLDENYRFIVLEVENQIRSTVQFLNAPSRELYDKIVSRDDYIDNLKTIIENKCYSRIHTDKSLDMKRVDRIRAVQVVCVNLERIADYCVNIARQTGYLSDQEILGRYDHEPFFDEIMRSMSAILPTYKSNDMSEALAICRSEFELDRMYKTQFDRLKAEIGKDGDSGDLITILFIFRYLERIGDSLLNIGEALIFAILGERIKIEQFDSLQQTLTKTGFSGSFTDIDFKSIWGTRSGCRISRVRSKVTKPGPPSAHGSIYKEGNLEKISKERENILRWKSLFPGIVAEIYGYNEEGGKGSMLLEFLPGCTLDELVLTGDREMVENAFFVLEQTLVNVWETTRKPGPVPTDYMKQLRGRLGSVLQIHPEFQRTALRLGDSQVDSSERLIRDCEALETTLQAPFAVFTHGDFNVNNVVYNHERQQIHFIDLYRSREYDYLQDVSVFLISNFRMPVFDPALRGRINAVIEKFFTFARDMAANQNDPTFEARMAFALARSFYTSTRFELNHKFAKEMFHRALFLLETIRRFGNSAWEGFRLPADVLYY